MAKIIVISPPSEFSQFLMAVFEFRGYDVVSIDCSQVKECVETVRSEMPDVIVADVGVALSRWGCDSSGWECLKSLKEDETTREIPAVAYSIILDELLDRQHQLRELGIPVVKNPGEIEDFINIIDRIIKSHSIISAA